MKLKALIIESTSYYSSMLDKILSDIGVDCDIYKNAEEALKSAKKAENIRLAIEKAQPNDLTINASIGAAAFSKNDNFDSLFEKVDRAVYEAKDSGRNKVVIHHDRFENVV